MECVLGKHKLHKISKISDKIEELMKTILKENERLQQYKYELEKIVDQGTQRLDSLSQIFQQKKEDIASRGEEWHRLIDKTVKTLQQELDDMQKEHESLLQKQKSELEEILRNIEEINIKAIKLKNSQNVPEIMKLLSRIGNQETPSEIMHFSSPVFFECRVEENDLKSYFGYIEKLQKRTIYLPQLKSEDVIIANHKILDVPKVIMAIDTGFEKFENDNRLFDIVTIDDNRMLMGGGNKTLKLFDFQGVLHDTISITAHGMYFTVYNKHVIYADPAKNIIYRVADDKAIKKMFITGKWKPQGITSTMSDDLLVCLVLYKDNLSKVVRYSSTGKVLQEIQYDSQGQPLYGKPIFITENVNGDVIVTDWKKNAVVAVDGLGIFRFSYAEMDEDFHASSVTTDPAGHVIVTDFLGDKIHMLDRDGRFLRYIIPDQGIYTPRAVCIIGDGEMIVGECLTGIAKRIRYLEKSI
jgi:hypothetical protein